jgi:hypothetical protein
VEFAIEPSKSHRPSRAGVVIYLTAPAHELMMFETVPINNLSALPHIGTSRAGAKPIPRILSKSGDKMPDGKSWSEMSLEEKIEHLYERSQDVVSRSAASEFSNNIVKIVDAVERDLIELRRQTGFRREGST